MNLVFNISLACFIKVHIMLYILSDIFDGNKRTFNGGVSYILVGVGTDLSSKIKENIMAPRHVMEAPAISPAKFLVFTDFIIDGQTGAISVKKELDHETVNGYNLTAVVRWLFYFVKKQENRTCGGYEDDSYDDDNVD